MSPTIIPRGHRVLYSASLLLIFAAQAVTAALPPPGQVIDLRPWALELPVRDVNESLVITYPQLANYTDPAYFLTAQAPNGTVVVFKVPAGGYKANTPTSLYPRTELRQVSNGTSYAAWKVPSNWTTTLTLKGAVQQFTPVVPEVVIAQLHAVPGQRGAAVPILVKVVANQSGLARPTNANNYVQVNFMGRRAGRLTSSYRLGDPYTLRITAGQGAINVYWNNLNTPKFTFDADNVTTSNYFKAGAYLQTNLTLGERATSYAEVWVYNLTISNNYTSTAGGNGTGNRSSVWGALGRRDGRLLRRRQMAVASARLW